MSHWIRLSKVPETDLWDVVATQMFGGALTWINVKWHAMEELDVQPWPTLQVFAKALKGQFEPLLKEERVREQIRKLV